MTLESVYGEECRLLKQCECVDLYEIGEVPGFYIPIEPQIQPLETAKNNLEKFPRPPQRRVFDHLLKKLQEMQFVGRNHAEEYLRDQYRRGCRDNTMRSSLKGIELFLTSVTNAGRTGVEQIVREDIFIFIETEQDRGSKPRTVMTRLRAAKAFLRFLIDQELADPKLLSRKITVKVPDSLPRAIDPEDVKRLLKVITHVRNRAMILVLLRTGMRIGELLDLRLRDINLKERRIEIYEAIKNSVGRVVYLSDDAHSALKKWFKKRDPHKEFVFYAMGRSAMTYQGARAMFVKYLSTAGLSDSGYTLHCLRHTFASELLNAGMRLECVQQLLGHSSIEMTRRYARLTDKTREEEYFRAMSIIERGEIDGYYRLDNQLQAIFEKKELLRPHGKELHERP
ncbi:MAG: tyrosine-type recombinase/integrase [Deltaproteobacteria bacterium]|nr:tyrosine-type recombinase/integrase [Deltaproteobacteria bacterium]